LQLKNQDEWCRVLKSKVKKPVTQYDDIELKREPVFGENFNGR